MLHIQSFLKAKIAFLIDIPFRLTFNIVSKWES